MCCPDFFDVTYPIDPWVNTRVTVDQELSPSQWQNPYDTFLALGHRVELIEPVEGLPDMVFTANCGIVHSRYAGPSAFRSTWAMVTGVHLPLSL